LGAARIRTELTILLDEQFLNQAKLIRKRIEVCLAEQVWGQLTLKYQGVLLIIAVVVLSHAEHLKTQTRVQSFCDVVTLANLESGRARTITVGVAEHFEEKFFPEAPGTVGRVHGEVEDMELIGDEVIETIGNNFLFRHESAAQRDVFAEFGSDELR